MIHWIQENGFAYGIIIVGIVGIGIYLCPDWIKNRIR